MSPNPPGWPTAPPPRNPHPPGSYLHAWKELALALEDLRRPLAGALRRGR